MFYFQLKGGLGNQMFQYAAARALSLHRGIPLRVDFDDPYKFVKREYGLDSFEVNVKHATKKELKNVKPLTKLQKYLAILTGKDPNQNLVTEKKDYTYDKTFFETPDNSYLSGFWQNEKYFIKYRNIIIGDFKLKNEPEGLNSYYLKHINTQLNSISVHIRRGDYVENPMALSSHGICDVEYYKKAYSFFEKLNTNNFYYCFSDDALWVEENLWFIQNKIIITNNDNNPAEDLRLMSNCKHNIIANSSFSWWGAWLNENPNKNVIAPSKWTNIHYKPDIIPSNWIIL